MKEHNVAKEHSAKRVKAAAVRTAAEVKTDFVVMPTSGSGRLSRVGSSLVALSDFPSPTHFSKFSHLSVTHYGGKLRWWNESGTASLKWTDKKGDGCRRRTNSPIMACRR